MTDKNFITPAIMKEFIAEFNEHIQSLELNILALEKEPGNLAILNDIFRSMHTLKGTAALLNLPKVSEFGHRLENLLDELRKGKRTVDPSIIDLLLSCLDVIRKLIDDVAQGRKGEEVNTADALRKIDEVLGKAPAAAAPAPSPAPAVAPGPVRNSEEIETFLGAAHQHLHSMVRAIEEVEKGNASPQLLDAILRAVHSLKASSSFMGFGNYLALVQEHENFLESARKENGQVTPEMLKACRQFGDKSNELCALIKTTGRDYVEMPVPMPAAAPAESPKETPPAENNEKDAAAAGHRVHHGEQNIRVSMQKLDHLINLISELIIHKSKFDQIGKRIDTGENRAHIVRDFKNTALSMERVTDELHTAIMDARMVTIGTLFNRFPRVVRELARSRNKDVDLAISGEDTDIDKTIIEEINDPLLHLIRNAADHGIESADVRVAAGKPARGVIQLRAYHESGNVIIEVEDDGKGMDRTVIKEKAIKNGIVSREQADQMSDQEALNLIFLPGFSTAEVVTDVSGRGVGMDVVKTNIEKLRGKVHIDTEKGKGTKIVLKLPLTMGMIETLMVRVGEEVFAIPLLSVSAIARIRNSEIKTVQGNEVVLLHGHTVETARLGKVLNVAHKKTGAKERVYLIVLEVRRAKGLTSEVGFIVDSVQDKQKIVIKPLDDSIVGTQGFSGAAILGDGRVALIIDPVEIVDLVTSGH